VYIKWDRGDELNPVIVKPDIPDLSLLNRAATNQGFIE